MEMGWSLTILLLLELTMAPPTLLGSSLLAPPQPPNVARRHLFKVSSGYVRQISETKLLIPGRHIQLMDCIGKGEFGVVYRAHLTGWEDRSTPELVAVKTLKGLYTLNDVNSMIEESLKMKSLKHPHVLSLIGVSIDAGDAPYIVMPYMANGSLLSFLRRERPHLTIAQDADMELIIPAQKELLSLCLQIARGMEYLAGQRFVHRDLAARNCMMDADHVIKVADFGLCEDVYMRNYFRQGREEGEVKLPVKWMAIESLQDGIFSEKTDVWSFGVTCWEVLGLGKTPYPGVSPHAIIKLLEGGQRLEKPSNAACSNEMYEVVVQCWKEHPEKRPTFPELVQAISGLLTGIADYLDFSAQPANESTAPPDDSYDHVVKAEGHGYDHLTTPEADEGKEGTEKAATL